MAIPIRGPNSRGNGVSSTAYMPCSKALIGVFEILKTRGDVTIITEVNLTVT